MTLQLDIRRDHQLCTFRFAWDVGQQVAATLPYPDSLTTRYQEWHKAYLSFYQHFTAPKPIADDPSVFAPSTSALRARVVGSGSLSSSEDRRSNLVQAEARLLSEFYRWLNSAQLVEVRRQILRVAKQRAKPSAAAKSNQAIDLFLTCYPEELERLPWEAWEINSEFDTTTTIQIVRIPTNIHESINPGNANSHRRRPRILAILGDDTGLDLNADCNAIRSLSHLAEIQWMSWRQGQDLTKLPEQIAEAISDERGWDALLFAGHSNAADAVGGELAIAPGQSIAMNELKTHLIEARKRGLQFALFNSCNGLNIAKSLIDWGISQVAVMREPIHNHVAQELLIEFLRHLTQHEDVHQSLLAVCQELKLVKNITYPSAHLVPCLFRHPAAKPFQIPPVGWKEYLKQWLPTHKQAIVLTGIAVLSVLLPVQGRLLEQRLWTQALYRRATAQVATAETTPIVVVQIDERSIQQAGIGDPNPIDRQYLAQLTDRLVELNTKVIGIDYLLDRPAEQMEEDEAIVKSIQAAANQGIWFVFATKPYDSGGLPTLLPNVDLPSGLSNWSLQGDGSLLSFQRGSKSLPSYVSLIYPDVSLIYPEYIQKEIDPLPFSYALALAETFNTEPSHSLQPSLQSQSSLLLQMVNELKQRQQDYTTALTPRSRERLITYFSYLFGQMWLHPVIDFSLPPDRVYETIPAWQLLEESTTAKFFNSTQQPIVIIAPGGYGEAGLSPGDDNMSLPTAVRHWRFWQTPRTASLDTLTGGEVHAYMLHHYLTDRLVVPIPDLWMIGIAAVLGKGTVLLLQGRSIRRRGIFPLVGATVLYGVVSLQVFISAAVLLPWLLPSIAYWTYVLPLLRKQR
jgi:CHASE2 domain-containing sensor protein